MSFTRISAIAFLGLTFPFGCGVESGDGTGGPGHIDGFVSQGDGAPVACIDPGACPENGPPDSGNNGDGGMNGNGDGGASGGMAFTPNANVDPLCALGQVDPNQTVLVPKWPTLANTVPNSCLVGYEINRLENNSYVVSSAAGSQAIKLEVDVATYTAADRVRLVAADANGNETVLLDTCRLRTATYADPTNGTYRPPEDTIRDFRLDLPAGTKKLTLDNTGAATPTYIRILGLCDFTLTASTNVAAGFWRKVTSR